MTQQHDAAAQPQFPKGTPEYDAYWRKLTAELTKFAAEESPYDQPIIPRPNAARVAGFGR